MSIQRLFNLFVVLALVVLGALTIRAGVEASAISESNRQHVIQLNQADDLDQPGVGLRVYPRLVEDEPATGTLYKSVPFRK
jgi:hypothetical protein